MGIENKKKEQKITDSRLRLSSGCNCTGPCLENERCTQKWGEMSHCKVGDLLGRELCEELCNLWANVGVQKLREVVRNSWKSKSKSGTRQSHKLWMSTTLPMVIFLEVTLISLNSFTNFVVTHFSENDSGFRAVTE